MLLLVFVDIFSRHTLPYALCVSITHTQYLSLDMLIIIIIIICIVCVCVCVFNIETCNPLFTLSVSAHVAVSIS